VGFSREQPARTNSPIAIGINSNKNIFFGTGNVENCLKVKAFIKALLKY
jgi:hypothetical protein